MASPREEDLHLDVETFSECDLKTEGIHNYAEHPSTELLVFCWAFGDEPVETWRPGDPVPMRIVDHIRTGGILRAFNAQFERLVLSGVAGRRIGFPAVSAEQTVCVAAKMRAHGLPGALGDAAKALGATEKDEGGRSTMLMVSKPRRGEESRYTRENSPERFVVLDAYCVIDVEAERSIDKLVPDLSPAEQQVYILDQRINDRGIRVDIEAVEAALAVVEVYKRELERQCLELTGYAPTQREKLANWIRDNGYLELPDMTADTVRQVLQDPALPPDCRKALLIFNTYANKAVSKLSSMLNAAGADGRMRGMFLYHGANTGRWSSLRVQLQNIFRGVISDPDVAIDALLARDLEWIRTLYEGTDPMKVVASCVRGMLVPAKGKVLQSIDYAGIESRVNAWLFEERWKLDAFRAFDTIIGRDEKGEPIRLGPDTYKLAYARSFGLTPDQVTKPQRQVGKVQELALGYEGGVGAFVTMSANYGIDLDELAEAAWDTLPLHAVESARWMWREMAVPKNRTYDLPERTYLVLDALKKLWRDAHANISGGWRLLKDAAIMAVQNPGEVYGLPNRKVLFSVRDKWLYMRLPSGRRLAYFKPRVEGEGPQASLRYYGVDTLTRRWGPTATYGGKLCENAVQAISRDLLVHGLHGLERARIPTIGTVHDEVISEVDESVDTLAKAQAILCELPAWAAGLPVATEGWQAARYRK